MRTALAIMAMASTVVAAAPPAAAQSAADHADVRCVLVLGVVGRDPDQRPAALQGTFYFLGRLQAHGMTPKLQELMRAEGQAITSQQQAQSELDRCGRELRQSTNALEAAYKALQPATPAAPAAKPATPAPKKK
jgi:hypothetical protein